MNTNLLNIVKQIIADYGEAVLGEPARMKAFFSDLAKDEPKPLRIAFGRCVEAGAYGLLKDTPDAAERTERKAAVTRRVFDEHGIAADLCAEALDILEAALYAGKQEPPRCASCGKELQEEWAVCPYCGKAAHQAEAPQPAEAPLPPPNTAVYTPPPPPVNAAVYAAPAPKKTSWKPAAAAVVGFAVIVAVVIAVEQKKNAVPDGMVRIAGGTFTMGSYSWEADREDDEISHQVTVNGFYMGKYEVTQQEWREVMGNNPSYFKGDNLPVETISWFDAVEYCNKRSQREGLTPAYAISGSGDGRNVSCDWSASGYRLPTEAEWEYAAKGGNGSPGNYTYSGSDSVGGVAWYDGNSGYETHVVGTKAPNALGLYDMSGNVWEWCWDWWGGYSGGAQTNPRGASSGSSRVLRGGCWFLSAAVVRSACRGGRSPSYRGADLGFRLVRP